MDAAQLNLFDVGPMTPALPIVAPVTVEPAPRKRTHRAKAPTLADFRPDAFKRSLTQKYREPRTDIRERIASYVLTAATRYVRKYYRGSPSDIDDIASEVAVAALERAYRWKRGKKTIEQYAFGCCGWAFKDVMRIRNSQTDDDALCHVIADRTGGLAYRATLEGEISEREEPNFEPDEE